MAVVGLASVLEAEVSDSGWLEVLLELAGMTEGAAAAAVTAVEVEVELLGVTAAALVETGEAAVLVSLV